MEDARCQGQAGHARGWGMEKGRAPSTHAPALSLPTPLCSGDPLCIPPPHPQCVSPSSSRSSGNVVCTCRPHCVLTTSILRVGFAAIPHPGGCGQGRSEAVNPGTLGLSSPLALSAAFAH